MLAFLLWRKYYTSQTKFVILLFIANAIYSFFYAFEISFKTLEEIIWFYRFEYFGIPFLATCYLLFSLHYSGRSKWLTTKNKLLIYAIPMSTLILVFTNEYHHIFNKGGKMDFSGPFPAFSFQPAFWYYVQQIYVVVAMLISIVFLCKMLKSTARLYKSQLHFILLATIFPFFGYLIYQLQLIPFRIDPVSFTFTLSGIVIYIALVRFKLFELVPIARSKLFEKIQEGVLVFDLNNRLVDYNQTACHQLNISKNDVGRTAGELLQRWPDLLRFMENNQKGNIDLKHCDGSKTYFYSIDLLELENSKNVKQGKLILIRDNSDLINTEQERIYTASKLDAVINAMPDMMFVLNAEGVFTDFFAHDSDKLFLNKEEVLGASLQHLFNQEEAATLTEMLGKCLESRELTTYQYEMNFPGVLKHYEARISRIDDNHVLVIVRDVTESHEMRQDLLYQSGFQNILMNLASRFIYVSESETDFVINDALRQIGEYIGAERSYLFRYDFVNDTMINSHEWCHDEIDPLIDKRQDLPLSQFTDWLESHKKGVPTRIENVKKLDPQNSIRTTLAAIDIQSIITIPMISQQNCLGFVGFESLKEKRKWSDSEISLLKIFTGMLANLLEKIMIEQSLVEARIKAEASNKLKTAFMNNISHEIRTPLNGIIGFGEIIANEQLSLDEKNKFLTVVQESSERLIQTIDDYLDISMLVTGNQEISPKNFNMASLIEEVVAEYVLSCEMKQLSVCAEVPDDLKNFMVRSDYDLIHKVFNHLISNSLKFTKRGSIAVGMSLGKDHVILYVKDTGIGIAENAQKYVFDTFMQEDFSSTRMYEGSGLGLAIVKGIITLLGGEITLSSTKGVGTTFSFTIPVDLKQNHHDRVNIHENRF
jgi:PAS domain S-box-containing protein